MRPDGLRNNKWRALSVSLSLLSMHNAQVSRIKIWDNPVTNAVEYYKLLPCYCGVISRCGFKCLRGVFAQECSYDESNWAGVKHEYPKRARCRPEVRKRTCQSSTRTRKRMQEDSKSPHASVPTINWFLFLHFTSVDSWYVVTRNSNAVRISFKVTAWYITLAMLKHFAGSRTWWKDLLFLTVSHGSNEEKLCQQYFVIYKY